MAASYVIGVDLGTTNSVVAYSSLDAEEADVSLLGIPQVVAAGTVESRTSLPSFIYLPTGERSGFKLPWDDNPEVVIGEFARRQSAEVPDRTVSNAKSWLCHHRVNRREKILPWNASDDVPKLAPVEASALCLKHLIAAWDNQFPEHRFIDQQIVLTVPASFDASARELTREAATNAGFPDDFVLLEEPQAAIYSWLAQVGDNWRKELDVEDQLFVIDVGGGTTDFSLVSVAEEDGDLMLKRNAVGNHLLVGGDNMDLTLAYHASQRFAESGTQLDPWQSVSLWHSCRAAKETLLAANAPDSTSISVLGRGKKLIGNSVSIEMSRDVVQQVILDGFFPECELDVVPAKQRASGFQEIGLPFESEAAVTRHAAAFLTQHGQAGQPARPTYLLVNGGVFKSQAAQARLQEVLSKWFPDSAPRMLEGTRDLDHAVALGATYYGWAKSKGGIRIRGGTARSYYIGIETSGPAIPGMQRPLHALCVVPKGMEEGTEHHVPAKGIGVVIGESALFRFFSSSQRQEDHPGMLLTSWDEDVVVETDPLETTLESETSENGQYVAVDFESRITELGVFELWCVDEKSGQRWKLEFSVREES